MKLKDFAFCFFISLDQQLRNEDCFCLIPFKYSKKFEHI